MVISMRLLILNCHVTMKAKEVVIMITMQCFLNQVKQVITANMLLTGGAEKVRLTIMQQPDGSLAVSPEKWFI